MRDKQDEERQEIFNNLAVPADCGSCNYILSTIDKFNTGDSPTAFECTGSHLVCPEVN